MTAPAYRIDGAPAGAEAFYALACDPQRSVVVEACAGAGKTWMLVSRMLRALVQGAEPRQILAITFTRKAAGEMRQRLDEWLLDFSAAHATHAGRVQALRQRGLGAEEAERLAPQLATLHEALLRAGHGVAISTFHAWFAQLLAQAPLALLEKLGLPARHELVEDTSVLHDELMRRVHRRVQADATLRASYVALVRRHRRGTVLTWLQSAWANGPELARADAAGNAEGAVPPAAALEPALQGAAHVGELLRRAPWRDEIATLARALGQAKGAKPQTAAQGLEQALQEADPAQALAIATIALFTERGQPRKQLGELPLLDTVRERLLQLGRLQDQQAAHEDHVALLALARVLLTEYRTLKQQRGLVDMADLERAAEALLGDSSVAGWMQQRLDQQLRLVLIDEFQDTSPLQWQVLQGWLSAYAGAGGGASGQQPLALFLVGDPKQSIYRFRGAEPRVFEAARAFVQEALDGRVLSCDHTRRNAPAVITALNAVFEDAARLDGWGPYRAHTTGSEAAGQVLRLPGVPRPERKAQAERGQVWRDSLTEPRTEAEELLKAQEANQVAAAVSALLADHGLPPGEVMVLARRRSMLALVAAALAAAGVPHVVAEPLLLHESPEVLDVAAVLDALVSPGHDLALARALKSPLFGAGDADLLALAAAARASGRSWLDELAAAAPTPSLDRARQLLGAWRPLVTALTPHDLLDRILHEGELLPRLAAAVPAARRSGALHAVQALLAATLQHEGGRFGSCYGLLRALKAGRLRATAAAPAGAVQLLTVHGAKGLEARAVVLADCDPGPRHVERAQVLVDWPVHASAPRRVAFVRSEAALPPSLDDAWAEHRAAVAREELNALYVAMTRAREWLVLSRTEPHRTGEGRSWWTRAEGHAAPWVPPAVAPQAGTQPVAVAVLPTLAAPPVPGPRDDTNDEHRARLGRAVHRVLEWGGQRLAEQALAAAREVGLPAAEAAAVQQLARRVLESPACRRFFSGPGIRWAGNEVPLAWQGHSLRVDRLVALDEGTGPTWWVLDYKLSHDPAGQPALREQLAQYVAAVQALQPGEPVRGAFITGAGELVVL